MTISNFFLFLINKNKGIDLSISNKLISFIIFFFLIFCIEVLFRVVIHRFIKTPNLVPFFEHKDILKYIFIILLGPLWEELIFRLNLIYNKFYFAISSSLILHLGISTLFNIKMFSSLYGIILLTFYIIIIYLFISYRKNINHILAKTFKQYFRQLYFISSIIFGFLHISNFEIINLETLFSSVIIIQPHIFLGLVLGYVRISFGFAWSVLFHTLHNLLIGFIVFSI